MRRDLCQIAAILACVLGLALAGLPATVSGGPASRTRDPVTIVVRATPIAEVFEMLSRKEKVNVLLADGVEGEVSVNLYDVSLDRAIRTIARSAGYVARRNSGTWLILKPEDAGKESAHQNTVVRAFKVQYSDPGAVADIVSNHLSRFGEITPLAERRLLVVEDLPEFVERVARLLNEIDREPRQILIEARILEISLNDEDAFGIDWVKFFDVDDGSGVAGVVGLAQPGNPGLSVEILNSNLAVFLNALEEKRRVRTLATPSLLALENQEAEVVIGDRLGFRVTTTINQVTSESVEFLESGVILKLTASVDRDGRILLDVHPEVSTGVLTDGLPSQTTTEVSTRLLTEDGQHVFIGGLINDRHTDTTTGVPILRDIPYLGRLFTGLDQIQTRTETVVLLAAHVRADGRERVADDRTRWVERVVPGFEERRAELEEAIEELGPDRAPPASPEPEDVPGRSTDEAAPSEP
jgi:type II secretory pathway component GspD/PulD (secretin)